MWAPAPWEGRRTPIQPASQQAGGLCILSDPTGGGDQNTDHVHFVKYQLWKALCESIKIDW